MTSEHQSRPEHGPTLRDYVHIMWRWKWVIIVAVCASTVVAYAYSWRQAPQYLSAASIMYVDPVDPSNPLSSNPYSSTRDLAVESVVNLIGSTSIVDRAQEALGQPPEFPYGVSTGVRGGQTEGTGGVVDVLVTSQDPREAAKVANAYAQAAVDSRTDRQLQRIELARRAVEARLSGYTTAASRLTTEYIVLEQQLANLKLLEDTVTGDFELIAQAYAPSDPYAPKPMRAAALGAGVGLLAGVALALLFNQFTTRVRSKQEAGEVLGLPVVGAIPEIDRISLSDGPLIALTHPDGPAAEALRLLRSNLDYLNVDDATSLMVTSALSGEGKSMTACNLAVTMAMAGRKVAILDGDLRRPRVHEYFAVPNEVGLSSVAAGDIAIADAIVRIDLSSALRPSAIAGSRSDPEEGVRLNPRVTIGGPRSHTRPDVPDRARVKREVTVLTAGPLVPDPGELVASEQFGQIIRALQADGMDLVIVDAPPLMEVGDAAAMAAEIEALVLVVDFKKARHETLVETRHLLHPLPCKKLGAILVKTTDGTSGYGYYS